MRNHSEHTEEASQALIATWNALYPVGTPVLVHQDRGEVSETTTRSPAWLTPSGGLLVSVVGISGGYRLSRVIPIPKSAATAA